MAQPPLTNDAALMEQALRMLEGFASWPRRAMDRIVSGSRVGRHVRGDVLADPSDPAQILAIVSGHVIVSHPGASQSAFAVCGPGMVVGFVRSFDDAGSSAPVYSAHGNVVAVHMPASLVLEILDQDPALWKGVMGMLLRQNRESVDAILDHLVGPLPQRLAATIERLVMLYGTRSEGATSVRLRLTQSELAALLQATRQSVNRELQSLVASGVISLRRNAITVLDAEALERLARP